MRFPLATWWKRDTALHTFVFCNFLVGLPFTVFNTYTVYQLQTIGFLLGTEANGQPCTTYCIVPWAGTELDLNSILLYTNAIGFGIGGVVVLFLSAYSDFWSQKHLLITIVIFLYGACSVPVYWLQSYTLENFDALTALWIVYAVLTYITTACLPILIPHCMRNEGVKGVASPATDQRNVREAEKKAKRSYGFMMSVFGQIANQVGTILLLVIVIILSRFLSGTAASSAGLLITTISGFITMAGALFALFGLPKVASAPPPPMKSWIEPLIEFLRPFRDLLIRKNLAMLLVSFTIYTDTLFAIGSVTSQLFVLEIRPGALEYSLYSLCQVLCIIGCNVFFLGIQPRLPVSLETWLIAGYALSVVMPVWGIIGFANIDFGYKMRWEFYVQLFISQLSQAFANNGFRVLLSESIPKGSEVRWCGLQVIISCGTVWVNYIASAPLQNATKQLRFPLVLSLVFLICPVVFETCRCKLRVFKHDREKWEEGDRLSASDLEEEAESNEDVKREKVTLEPETQKGLVELR